MQKQAVPPGDASTERKREAQRARAKEYGIEALEGKGERLTFGTDMPRSLSDYADPVNLKFPLVPEGRARNARARFKQFASTYTQTASKRIVHTRIVERLLQIGASPGFDPDDPLDKLLPARLRDRMQGGEKKARRTMSKSEEKLFVEVNKVEMPEGMEMLDFGGTIMGMLAQAKAKLKKSLMLIGIYNDHIVTKDRETGKLFKMSLATKDGEIDLGEPVEVRQQFIEVKAKTEKKVKKVDVETGETNGHKHTATVDEAGNGKTNEVEGHYHEIAEGVVAEADGHKHSLERPEEMGDKGKDKATKSEDAPEYIELPVQKSANLWSDIIR